MPQKKGKKENKKVIKKVVVSKNQPLLKNSINIKIDLDDDNEKKKKPKRKNNKKHQQTNNHNNYNNNQNQYHESLEVFICLHLIIMSIISIIISLIWLWIK